MAARTGKRDGESHNSHLFIRSLLSLSHTHKIAQTSRRAAKPHLAPFTTFFMSVLLL